MSAPDVSPPERLAQLQGDQNYRNVRLTGTHLFMQESFRYERREVIEWLDEDVGYRWQEAGEIAPREPTVAEVEAWLASQRMESPPPASLVDATRRLLEFRAHRDFCEVAMTEFCTCGMKEVADEVRALLGASKGTT